MRYWSLFTVEDAFDASEAGEPIHLTREGALHIVRGHHADEAAFQREVTPVTEIGDGGEVVQAYDAAHVLGWLGY